MELLTYIGIGIFIIGGIGFLIAAFKVSVWWGIACILVSPVSIVFLFMEWSEAKNPFFLQLFGLSIVVVASIFSGGLNI